MALYIKQLLAGRDFAKSNFFATQMANFVYLIGDDEQKVCMVVDPAWDIPGIVAYAEEDNMRLIGVLVTHYHPDHIGGDIFGHSITGLAELMAIRPVKVHVNDAESAGVKQVSGLSDNDLAKHQGGDKISIGNVRVRLLHTPGHTPGSQCFLADSTLVSGDTLFIGGCGRVDLPGGNPEQMYHSLTQVLAKLPEDTLLYPGHNYAEREASTIGDEKKDNRYMRIGSLEDWRRLMHIS